MTSPHSRDDSKMLSFLTNYATSADVPTAATQEYNLTLFNQHLLSVTSRYHNIIIYITFFFCFLDPKVARFGIYYDDCESALKQVFFKASQAPFEIFVLPPPSFFSTASLLVLHAHERCSTSPLVSKKIKGLQSKPYIHSYMS